MRLFRREEADNGLADQFAVGFAAVVQQLPKVLRLIRQTADAVIEATSAFQRPAATLLTWSGTLC